MLKTNFYRTLAAITRGALSALREELSDEETKNKIIEIL